MSRLRRTGRYGLLLVALVGVLLVVPPLAEAGTGLLAIEALFAFLVVSAALAVGTASRLGRVAVALAAATLGGDLLLRLLDPMAFQIAVRSAGAAVLAAVTAAVVMRIVREERVSLDTILGGVCAYLLLGFLFHALFAMVELLRPGSFASGGVPLGELSSVQGGPGRSPALVYFSFATLTTVGYGDVVATWSLPQVLAVAEATLGQLYLAILVASLVGMHMQSRRVGPAD